MSGLEEGPTGCIRESQRLAGAVADALKNHVAKFFCAPLVEQCPSNVCSPDPCKTLAPFLLLVSFTKGRVLWIRPLTFWWGYDKGFLGWTPEKYLPGKTSAVVTSRRLRAAELSVRVLVGDCVWPGNGASKLECFLKPVGRIHVDEASNPKVLGHLFQMCCHCWPAADVPNSQRGY